MAQVYLHDIPSIRSANPGLPPILIAAPTMANMNLDSAIAAGQPLNIQDIDDARATAQALKALSARGNPTITPEVAESAQLRVLAVQTAHVSAAYTPVDIAAQQQQFLEGLAQVNDRLAEVDDRFAKATHRLNMFENRLVGVVNDVHGVQRDVNRTNDRLTELTSIVNAIHANSRIMRANFGQTLGLQPLQKSKPGHGLARAQAVCPQCLAVQLPPAAAVIGTVPGVLQNTPVSDLSHQEILDLIVFYNDDFGIVVGDGLTARHDKVRIFMTGN